MLVYTIGSTAHLVPDSRALLPCRCQFCAICWVMGISCTLRDDFTNLPYHCPIAHLEPDSSRAHVRELGPTHALPTTAVTAHQQHEGARRPTLCSSAQCPRPLRWRPNNALHDTCTTRSHPHTGLRQPVPRTIPSALPYLSQQAPGILPPCPTILAHPYMHGRMAVSTARRHAPPSPSCQRHRNHQVSVTDHPVAPKHPHSGLRPLFLLILPAANGFLNSPSSWGASLARPSHTSPSSPPHAAAAAAAAAAPAPAPLCTQRPLVLVCW